MHVAKQILFKQCSMFHKLMCLTLIARQPKNLLQKHKTIIILSFHRKIMSINTNHAVNVCMDHNRDESAQITEWRRRVQTLTSCVSAQASWPENCPCAKRKRVKQRQRRQKSEKSPSRKLTNFIDLNSVHQDPPHIFHFTHNLNK